MNVNTAYRYPAATILVGAGLYGATIGVWRSPLQALYSGIKFPLIIFLTVVCTAMINHVVGSVWGARFTLREGFLTILKSFALTCLVLGSLSPVLFFAAYNTPSYTSLDYERSYGFLRLAHVAAIALAGIIGTGELAGIVRGACATAATRVIVFWLAMNLFVGAQLSWVLRPFIGSPLMPVEFLRENPLKGNFYEEVWKSFTNVAMEEYEQSR